MIGPLEIHRASRRWRCGWLVAWTRLRYRREFWQEQNERLLTDVARVDVHRSRSE